MSSTLVRNVLVQGKYNNYLVGGNICNAFALGDLGSTDDFFLVGAEPLDESNYPLLTEPISKRFSKLGIDTQCSAMIFDN